MEYQESSLVAIAQRENNTKRNYLVVNRLQGKHIPVGPHQALAMFQALADSIQPSCGPLLVIGFAETATAIGAAVAVSLGAYYMQTTREEVPGCSFFSFSEEHSHATGQKLVKNDLDAIIGHIRQILFVEDEITTGNTILNIIRILQKQYPNRLSFAAASILNGMDAQALERFRSNHIGLSYLVKTDHTPYAKAASQCQLLPPGRYVPCMAGSSFPQPEAAFQKVRKAYGWINARRLTAAKDYEAACENLWQAAIKHFPVEKPCRVLVLGTEEFMYPALYVAAKIAETGSNVKFHATTRSPAAVYGPENYPFHTRYELCSLYDRKRRTFLYDIGTYDKVLVITDAQTEEPEGICSLLYALSCKNKPSCISIIRWA